MVGSDTSKYRWGVFVCVISVGAVYATDRGSPMFDALVDTATPPKQSWAKGICVVTLYTSRTIG